MKKEKVTQKQFMHFLFLNQNASFHKAPLYWQCFKSGKEKKAKNADLLF